MSVAHCHVLPGAWQHTLCIQGRPMSLGCLGDMASTWMPVSRVSQKNVTLWKHYPCRCPWLQYCGVCAYFFGAGILTAMFWVRSDFWLFYFHVTLFYPGLSNIQYNIFFLLIRFLSILSYYWHSSVHMNGISSVLKYLFRRQSEAGRFWKGQHHAYCYCLQNKWNERPLHPNVNNS